MVFGGKKQEQTAGDNSTQTQIETQNNYNINIIQYREDIDINEQQKKSQESIPKQEVLKPIIPHFSLPVPDSLLHRDNEEEKLYGLISRNRIVNLVGVGGSGKSSLAYLCLDKHKNDFNEIAYVVVNNNIKDDFVEQINKTLKLDIKNDPVGQNDFALKLENKNDFLEQINKTSKQKIRDDVYSIIISYLQENYKAEKQNLLILDINETSDKNKNAEIIKEIIKNNISLEGWKFLILSREKVDTRNRIKSHNLNYIEDIEFLKELFIDKVGNRYNDFDDFQELFKAIYYNPLLTEQLGYYLKRQPKVLTINDIKSILYGDSFKETDMNGLSAQRHDEKIISFLKKIIIFDNLEENEKELLRHFVLWPSDYILYDVIKGLLQRVFESEDQLVATLASLSERSILTTNDEQTLSYKLHGLLAESLREQIDIRNENYNYFLLGIIDKKEYCYKDYLPYADCIVNSLCKYNIVNIIFFRFINDIGEQLCELGMFDYAQRVLEKNIERIEEFIDENNSNSINHDDLSDFSILLIKAHILIGDYLNDDLHIEKAIELLKQMIKSTKLFERNHAEIQKGKNTKTYIGALAETYLMLAKKQTKYNNVESIFKKIFIIHRELPESNETQIKIANDYYSLARINQKFKKFRSAKANFKIAIDLYKKTQPDDPIILYNYALIHNSLADLQITLKESDSAKANLEIAIDIIKKINDDSFKNQNALAGLYNNFANLQRLLYKDYYSAKTKYLNAIEISEKLPDKARYQNDLAQFYINLANLQRDCLKEYEQAKIYYKKAINISLKLPNNRYYQTFLAYAYRQFALYYNNQKKYTEAIEIEKKAIDISKDISNDIKNTELQSYYLCRWIEHKQFLAEIFLNNGEVKKAKDIWEEIKPLAEKCLTENPNVFWTDVIINSINYINKLLAKCSNL